MTTQDPHRSPGRPDGGKPAKADWRRTKAGPTQSAATKKKGGSWQVKIDQPYEDAVRWYRVKVASWCLVLLTLVAVLIYVLIPWPKRTPFLCLAVTDYGAAQGGRTSLAIPPNGWADEDLERFQALDQKEQILDAARLTYAGWESGAATFQNLREAIRKLKGDRRKSMIVYLSVHGVVNEEGQPCLILPGASPYRSKQWLPLRDLLVYLFPKDYQDALPAKKLLILDCSRIDVHWPLGLLYNGFADRIEAVLDELSIPGLFVLNATSPGQVAWTSPEQLHGSVFAHYLCEGLRGAADRQEEKGNSDGEISLQELYAYVRAHVSQWVRENRDDVQEPMLLPKKADIRPLVHAKPLGTTPAAKIDTTADPRWDEIAALWQRHAELARPAPGAVEPAALRLHPLGWEDFQHKLLRLEQLVQGGRAYDDEFAHLRRQLEDQAAALADQGPPGNLAAFSLPLAQQFHRDAKYADERQALERHWKAHQQFDLEPDQKFTYQAAAAVAWQLCRDGLAADRWPEALKPCQAVVRAPKLEPVELHYLHLLQGYLDPPTRAANGPLLTAALAAHDLAERAAAPADERAWYWVRPLADRADADRRQADDELFIGSPAALADAAPRYAKLATAEPREGSYGEAVARAEQVATAYAIRDRAWSATPYLAQWLFARLHPTETGRITDLETLIDATQDLGDQLDRAQAAAAWPSSLDRAVQSVETKLKSLTEVYQRECSRLWEPSGADPNILRGIGTVLAVPLVTGEERNRLRRKYLEIASATAGPRGAVATVAVDEAITQYLDRLSRPNRHPALAILHRVKLESDAPRGAGAATAPANALREVADAKNLRERVRAAAEDGGRLRQLLDTACVEAEKYQRETAGKLAPGEKFTPPEVRSGCSKADRLLRAAAPLLDPDPNPWTDPAADPVHQLRRIDLYYLFVWHAHRALDDFWGPPPGSEGPPFFQIAAGDYLESARELLRGYIPKLRDGEVDVAELLKTRVAAAQAGIRPKPKDLLLDKDEPVSRGDVGARLTENLPPGQAALYLRAAWRAPAPSPVADDPTLPLQSARSQPKPDLRRIAVPIASGRSHEEEKYAYWVRSNEPRLRGKEMQAVALYRGHVYTNPFAAEFGGEGVLVTHERPVYPDPVVTVHGEAVQECPIMFIIDFSGSIDAMMTYADEKGRPVEENRFKIEVDTLCHILRRLATPDNRYLVGLLVYGHRVGWDWDEAERRYKLVVWDPKHPGTRDDPGKTIPRPPGNVLLPSQDVEQILPLGRLRQSDPDDVARMLSQLRPLGETPLYVAIAQAVEILNAKRPSTPDGWHSQRHIIAITDGVDQTTDERGQWAPSDTIPLERLFKLPNNQDIRLDVVGFDVNQQAFVRQVVPGAGTSDVINPATLSPQQQSLLNKLLDRLADLKRLAGQTGDFERGKGAFYDAEKPANLVRALEKSLQLTRYVVRRAKESQGMSFEPRDLNSTTPLGPCHGNRIPLLAQVEDPERPASSEFEVEGGEALELFLTSDRRQLEYRRYTRELRDGADNLPDPDDSSLRYYVAAHLPKWDEGNTAVWFYVSIQNADPKRFSPRPEEAWMQVRPILPAGAPPRPAYIFYDLNFKAGLPVPMLAYKAANWPREAKRAEIRLWFKRKKTPLRPGETITVGDFRRRGGTFQLDSIPGVTFELETQRGEEGAAYRVMVTERHLPGSTLELAKVEIDGAYSRVIHHYTQQVKHTFSFDDTLAGTIDNLTISITPHSRLVERAVSLSKPLSVDIPNLGLVSP